MPGNGNQDLTLRVDHPATASDFNKINTNIIKPGIYKGGLLTNPSGNDVDISTLVLIVECSTGETVKVTTSEVATLEVSELAPYIVYSLNWDNTDPDNFGVFSAKYDDGNFNGNNVYTNEIVLGKAIYTGGVITGFDYTDRTRAVCDIEGNVWVPNNLSVKGVSSLQGNVVVGGNLTVPNNVTISSLLSCNGSIKLPLSVPASPVEGNCYFDSGTNTLYVYNGTGWVSTTLS